MSLFLFIAGALMLAFAAWRIAQYRRTPQFIVLYLIAATGSGLVTAAALMAIAP